MARQDMTRHDVIMPIEAMGELPTVRLIYMSDVFDAIRRGIDDFKAMPTHAVFLAALYPVVGLLLGAVTFGYDLVPVLYPLVSGFALVGAFAAIGLYELSRRREAGLDTSAKHVLDVVHSPSLPSILALGGILVAIFGAWLYIAHALYIEILGRGEPTTISAFLSTIFGTEDGMRLILIGNAVGLVFALIAFCLSVISFPLLLDRHVGFGTAVGTSLRAIALNPAPMALWALVVAIGLFAGSLLFLFGLAVVMPVLGHATWHLYRKVVEPDFRARPDYHPREGRGERYGADFPVSLFARYRAPEQPPRSEPHEPRADDDRH